MSSGAWITFRAVRIVVFALATLLCMASTVIYTVLLLREWKSYDAAQHVIVIISLTVNAVSAILLYLMIVVQFRLWLEAARVAFVVFLQLGGTITFAIFGPATPCGNLGSEASCRIVVSIVINLGWGQTGLLLLYAFYLAAMSHVPLPPPRPNPEAALTGYKRSPSPTSSINSESYLLKRDAEKRKSGGGSVHSHGTFIQPLSANPSLHGSSQASVRSISVSSRHKYGVYRPVTPASFQSKASSSYSGIRGYEATPVSPFAPTPRQLPVSQPLTNPFTDFEPANRHPSPSSESSSIHSGHGRSGHNGRLYTTAAPHSAAALSYGFNGSQGLPPPPYLDQSWIGHPGLGRPSTRGQLTVPPTPVSLRPSFQASLPSRQVTASPGVQSVRSFSASLHDVPNRSAITSPTMSTRSLGLPATPRLGTMVPPPPAATSKF